MDDRWETATAVVVNVVYAVAVIAMVVLATPPLRAGLLVIGRQQVHAWRYGRWLAGRTRPPAWTTLLERDDLPAEAT